MSARSARFLGGCILLGSGVVAFAIGDLARATNSFYGLGKSAGVVAALIGIILMSVPGRDPGRDE